MRKRLIGIIILFLFFGSGCKANQPQRILTPDGIPCIALGGLMDDWDIQIVSGADLITSELIKAEYDIIVAPISAAAKIYLLGNTNYQCKAIITTGNTYLAKRTDGNLNFDLDGKKLGAYGENNIPDFLLSMYLSEQDRTPLIQYEASVNDVLSNHVLSSQPSEFFLLAEPFLSLAEIKQQLDLTILDLQNELTQLDFIPQAGVFMKKDLSNQTFLVDLENNISYLNSNPEAYADELLELPQSQVPTFSYLGKEVIIASIPRSNIGYYPIDEYKSALHLFFEEINQFNSQILGGTIPDEAFYG